MVNSAINIRLHADSIGTYPYGHTYTWTNVHLLVVVVVGEGTSMEGIRYADWLEDAGASKPACKPLYMCPPSVKGIGCPSLSGLAICAKVCALVGSGQLQI